MRIEICEDRKALGASAARHAAQLIEDAIDDKGSARIIAATGASQFDFLASLTQARDVDRSKITMFHLDEYVGLMVNHTASERRYLKERLMARVNNGTYNLMNQEQEPD